MMATPWNEKPPKVEPKVECFFLSFSDHRITMAVKWFRQFKILRSLKTLLKAKVRILHF